MSIFTEDVVTRYKGDTTDLNAASQRAAGIVVTSQQRMVASSRAASAAVGGIATSLGALASGNVSAAIGSISFQLAGLSQAALAAGKSTTGLLARIGPAAGALGMVGVAVAAAGAIYELGSSIDRMARAESIRRVQEMAAELAKLTASAPSWITDYAPGDESTPAWLQRSGRVAGARVAASRTGRAAGGGTPSETLSAFRALTPDAMRQLDEAQGMEAAGRSQAALDQSLAARNAAIQAHMVQVTSEVRATLEENGIDPEIGMMGFVVGKGESTDAALARLDLQAAQYTATMQRMAAATRTAAAASTQAFLSTLVATRSFGAATKAAVKSYMDTKAQMSIADAGREVALAVGRLAIGDGAGFGMHMKSAGLHAAAGVAYGLVGASMGGGGGGAGGGGTNNQFVGNSGIGANAPAGGGGTTINVNVNVPPGGEARAGREFLASINAHMREQGRREIV